MSKVATRFAPSPTGPLHIGGIRTALFNWLFSKNQKGNFYLRIEDTDKERSKDEYKKQIIKSLKWIGIEYNEDEYIQSKKIDNHIKVANELLKNGHAYKCYCSEKEIIEQKEIGATINLEDWGNNFNKKINKFIKYDKKKIERNLNKNKFLTNGANQIVKIIKKEAC